MRLAKQYYLNCIKARLTSCCKNPKLIHDLHWDRFKVINMLQQMKRELKRVNYIYGSASNIAWGESPEIKHYKIAISDCYDKLNKIDQQLKKEVIKP